MDRKKERERGNDIQQRATRRNRICDHCDEDTASVYGVPALPTEPLDISISCFEPCFAHVTVEGCRSEGRKVWVIMEILKQTEILQYVFKPFFFWKIALGGRVLHYESVVWNKSKSQQGHYSIANTHFIMIKKSLFYAVIIITLTFLGSFVRHLPYYQSQG